MNLNGMSALSDIVSVSGFSISGDIIGVIIFVVIVCMVVFAKKLPTSNKEAKGSTLFGRLGMLLW